MSIVEGWGNGRIGSISFTDYGRDGDTPLLAFHGVPDSRHIWSMMADDARNAGVRLVAFDRPGFGDRPQEPTRSALQSAQDAATVADALGLDRFSVIGISGGAVHALAAAHELGHRVNRVTVMSGWCLPSAEGRSQMQPPLRILVRLVERQPIVARLIVSIPVGLAKLAPLLTTRAMLRSRPPGDRSALERPQFNHMLANVQSQFMSPSAIVQDLAHQLAPWPFDLEKISQPAMIWHGGLDDVHPPMMAQYLERSLPNARLHTEPDCATFDLFPLFDQILRQATTGHD